jgi:hypothetical protein
MRVRSVLALCGLLLWPTSTRADRERVLTDFDTVRAACDAAERTASRELLVVSIESGWTFGTLTEEGFLPIETRRNFRMSGERVELFASRLEPVGLIATSERAVELETARTRGAELRIGFFLGFDEPDRTACLIRSRHAFSTIRMDVAFVELVRNDGTVIAREDTERYRAWQDDAERAVVPGEGPRAQIGTPSLASGAVPDAWQQGLATAAGGPIGQALSNCHRDGVARGAEGQGRIVIRVRVDGRTGRVLESGLAVSNIGDTAEAECMATALRVLNLSPGPGDFASRTVDLEVPIRLAAD